MLKESENTCFFDLLPPSAFISASLFTFFLEDLVFPVNEYECLVICPGKILKSTTERISCGGSKEEAHHEEGSPMEGH